MFSRKLSYQVQILQAVTHILNAIASSGPGTAKGISHRSKIASVHMDRFLHSYALNFSCYLAKLNQGTVVRAHILQR